MITYDEMKAYLILGLTYTKIAHRKKCSVGNIHKKAIEWGLDFIYKNKKVQFRLREERRISIENIRKEARKQKQEDQIFYKSKVSNSMIDKLYAGRRYDRE